MQIPFSLADLEQFIVRAKSKTYVGGAKKLLPYRLASNDIQYHENDWAYHDSYFGESDFIGQEVIYFKSKPIWAMNYYGYILNTNLITSTETGKVIMSSLTKMYSDGRFLGGFVNEEFGLRYEDKNEGDLKHFTGKERILRDHLIVYELIYHGGLIKY